MVNTAITHRMTMPVTTVTTITMMTT